MNILKQKFDNEEIAQKYWDDSRYDMLDIALYLTDNKLYTEASEFCSLFGNEKRMSLLTQYKFDFDIIKKFLGIPQKYIDRNEDLKNLNDIKRHIIVDESNTLQEKYNSVMQSLKKEIEKVKTS